MSLKDGVSETVGGAADTGEEACWFFAHAEFDYGPLTDAQLCEAVETGLLGPADKVWRSDIPEPFLAADVEGLFDEGGQDPADQVLVEGTEAGSAGAGAEFENQSEYGQYRPPAGGSGSLMCPYCWYRFEPEDFLFVATHEDLRGDSVLGSDELQRFLPDHLNPDGHAIDAYGGTCVDRACPHCHLRIPQSLVSLKPLFVSIVGASGSGKSYLLACMCWKLRTTLLERFNIRFTDADAVVNMWLNTYERLLFVQPDKTKFQFIEKTQMVSDGRNYREVAIDNMSVLLSMPSMFNLQADEASIYHQEEANPINRTLVAYDNAGEQFASAEHLDSAANPGTKHLMHSEAVLFLFDPTMDVKFRDVLADVDDIQLQLEQKVDRQDLFFTETINRIRKNLGLDPTDRYEKPVLVILSKADVLGVEVSEFLDKDPWQWDEDIEAYALDFSCIAQASFAVRSMLQTHAPEAVSAVEAFAKDIVYLPVSALGHSPTLSESSGELVVRPCDVTPKWAEVPFLYVLFKLGYVKAVAERGGPFPVPERYRVSNGMFHFVIPGTSEGIRLPLSFAGIALRCKQTGDWFRVPDNDA